MFRYICIVNNAHGYVNELYYMHFHIKIKSFFLTYAILKFPSFYMVLLYPMDDKLLIQEIPQWEVVHFLCFNWFTVILFELSEVLP